MDQALEKKFEAFKRRFPMLLTSDTAKDEDIFPAFYLHVAYFKDAFSERIANEAASGAYASMTNGAYAFAGAELTPRMLK